MKASSIKLCKAATGTNVKTGANKMKLAEQLIAEIAEWKRKNRVHALVILAASTEIYLKQHPFTKTLDSFEKAMRDNHKAIAPQWFTPTRH